jgi:hypothetical protein
MNMLTLKICIFSGKVIARMVSSNADCHLEWAQHVKQVEARFGAHAVAVMITDSGSYFESHQMQNFNQERGVIHVQSPPYTQELDGLVERTLGIVLGMVRTAMAESGAPEAAYGECIMAMVFVLNVLPHKTGAKLSRNEKYEGRLKPKELLKLRPWGCAAYLHLDYVRQTRNHRRPGQVFKKGDNVFYGGLRSLRHGVPSSALHSSAWRLDRRPHKAAHRVTRYIC